MIYLFLARVYLNKYQQPSIKFFLDPACKNSTFLRFDAEQIVFPSQVPSVVDNFIDKHL